MKHEADEKEVPMLGRAKRLRPDQQIPQRCPNLPLLKQPIDGKPFQFTADLILEEIGAENCSKVAVVTSPEEIHLLRQMVNLLRKLKKLAT